MFVYVRAGEGQLSTSVLLTLKKFPLFVNRNEPWVQGCSQPVEWLGSHWCTGPTDSKTSSVSRMVCVVVAEDRVTKCSSWWSKIFQIPCSSICVWVGGGIESHGSQNLHLELYGPIVRPASLSPKSLSGISIVSLPFLWCELGLYLKSVS
jgi:hypothetical protein